MLEKVLHQGNLFGIQSNIWLAVNALLITDNIIIEAKNDSDKNVKGNELVFIKTKDEMRDENVLAEMSNNHYINIAEIHQDLLQNL